MMITVGFEDFKRICDEYSKRLYYYIAGNIVEMYFISDGVFVKSFVDSNLIENKEVFFGDKMFTGAVKLLFRLPAHIENSVGISDIMPQSIYPSDDIVDDNSNDEAENIDIQEEGVDGSPHYRV